MLSKLKAPWSSSSKNKDSRNPPIDPKGNQVGNDNNSEFQKGVYNAPCSIKPKCCSNTHSDCNDSKNTSTEETVYITEESIDG